GVGEHHVGGHAERVRDAPTLLLQAGEQVLRGGVEPRQRRGPLLGRGALFPSRARPPRGGDPPNAGIAAVIAGLPTGRDALLEVADEILMAAAVGFGKAEDLASLRHETRGRLRVLVLAGEALVRLHVGPGVEEDAVARQTVATGAPDLLIVALDGARQVVVHDEADVGLVDAHAERDGRD